jgi:hypothetical protein
MFEFHGWINIVVDGLNSGIMASRLLQETTLTTVRQIIAKHSDDFSLFEARVTSNDMVVVLAHGLRNHRREEAIRLFSAIGEAFPQAFGLLHVHDDEAADFNNFRVFRLTRGTVQEFPDPFLSPRSPVVEDEYSGDDD